MDDDGDETDGMRLTPTPQVCEEGGDLIEEDREEEEDETGEDGFCIEISSGEVEYRPALSEKSNTTTSKESILTARSYARNVPGLEHGLSKQEKGLMKCITQRILKEVLPSDNFQNTIQLVVPGTVNSYPDTRYLVILSDTHDESFMEQVALGINIRAPDSTINPEPCPHHEESPMGCRGELVIAMALPITSSVLMAMDGDGGMALNTPVGSAKYVFKPVNMQALWTAHSYVYKSLSHASFMNHFTGNPLNHTWAGRYIDMLPPYLTHEEAWLDRSQIEEQVEEFTVEDPALAETFKKMYTRIHEILSFCTDLDSTNCLTIRKQLEAEFNFDLTPYKKIFAKKITQVFGQWSEPPSKIFDYLYLGTEWNASNLAQLKKLGVTHVLNVTMEINNYFGNELSYMAIRVRDQEDVDLRQHWEKTYQFIKRAKDRKQTILVHCRFGISRSASCVCAYIMKEYKLNLRNALNAVKDARPQVKPNQGFYRQLEEYNGILDARYNEMHGLNVPPRPPRCAQEDEQKLIVDRWRRERISSTISIISTDFPAEDSTSKVTDWIYGSQSMDKVLREDLIQQLNRPGEEVVRTRSHSTPGDNTRSLQPLDSLSADGPFSPEDLASEVAATTGEFLEDSEAQNEVGAAVIGRIRKNRSIRQSTGKGSNVISKIIEFEVRTEVGSRSVPKTGRSRAHSDHGGTGSRRHTVSNKKIRQTHSVSGTSHNSVHPVADPKPKKSTKLRHGGQKICASIKKIIERLLSPRDKPVGNVSAVEEIQIVAQLEGTVYDKKMSGRKVHSGDYSNSHVPCEAIITPPSSF